MYWSELFSSKNCVTLSNFFNSLISLTFGVRVPCRISIHICCALESDYKSKPNLWNIYTFMKSHLNDKLMLRTNFTFLVHFFIFFIVIVCLKYIPNTGFDDAFKRCAIKKKTQFSLKHNPLTFSKIFRFCCRLSLHFVIPDYIYLVFEIVHLKWYDLQPNMIELLKQMSANLRIYLSNIVHWRFSTGTEHWSH